MVGEFDNIPYIKIGGECLFGLRYIEEWDPYLLVDLDDMLLADMWRSDRKFRFISEFDDEYLLDLDPLTLIDMSFEDGEFPIKVIATDPKISHRVEERSTADFELYDPDGSYSFEFMQEVIIYDYTGEILFGGLVQEVEERMLSVLDDDDRLVHRIQATDYHLLAEKRLFVGAYEGPVQASTIIDDIMLILAEDEVVEGEIQSGAELENQTFAYVTCAEALDKLAELSGYTWFISRFRELYFVDRASYTAAFNISDNYVLEESVSVINGNPNYRNVQYITGSTAETNEQTDEFVGDGTVRAFTCGYPLSQEPVITLNSVAQTVGIKGVESGKNWYWNRGENTIAQEYSDPVLTDEDLLEVTYIGSYPLIAKVSQQAAVNLNATVMGFGSGKIENLYVDQSQTNQAAAQESALAKLLHYATSGIKIVYQTNEAGLAAGTLQTITLTKHGITAASCLISSITITFGAAFPTYEVEAVAGPVEESWEKLFCNLADAARARNDQTAGEVSTVQGLEQFSKIWYGSDHPSPFGQVYPDAATFPGDPDFPCLATGDRLKYLVLYTDGSEFFRKAITAQTDISDTEIDTTCIVLAAEANTDPISHVGLWGGDTCTSSAASGCEMEKHVYVKTKNKLEAIQFDFEDTYGGP